MKTTPLVSVVIPNYNRAYDVAECVKSVKNSTYDNYEIIIVDDCSNDNSLFALNELGIHVVEHESNRGPAAARNTGAENSKGEILLFIDSDVIIRRDSIEKYVKEFSLNEEYSAIVGLPGKPNNYKNLFTTHFLMRVFHNYSNLPKFISHTCGTITAVRREIFERVGGYNEKLRTPGIEDDEFGLEICRQGGRIYLDKKNDVIHNKTINFTGIIKNDILRTIDRVLYLFRKSQVKDIVREKRFISTPMGQLISAVIAPIIVILFILSIVNINYVTPACLVLFIFFYLNYKYLLFIKKEMGTLFTLRLFIFLIIDMSFVHLALWFGLVQYLFGRRY